ncbi:MAG: nucleoside-diphosphate kinase [Limisphaerales bacterium]
MSEQLAYVIITPYSLYKSRTGGILTRLITRTGLDLVGMRMFAPSTELVKEYAETIVSAHDTHDRKIQELLKQYVLENLSPDPKTGRHRRVMVLLFRGDEAVRKVRSVVGNLSPDRRSGETIRDTYSDLIIEDNGNVRYFEPAVLAAPHEQEADAKLKLWRSIRMPMAAFWKMSSPILPEKPVNARWCSSSRIISNFRPDAPVTSLISFRARDFTSSGQKFCT